MGRKPCSAPNGQESIRDTRPLYSCVINREFSQLIRATSKTGRKQTRRLVVSQATILEISLSLASLLQALAFDCSSRNGTSLLSTYLFPSIRTTCSHCHMRNSSQHSYLRLQWLPQWDWDGWLVMPPLHSLVMLALVGLGR